MSLLIAVPESITEAAADLTTIGAALHEAHTMAAASTSAVVPAAADEVSASIAQLFSGHAAEYQKLAGEAAAFHEQFVRQLNTSAETYASAEAFNFGLLQPVVSLVDSILRDSGLQEPLYGLLSNVLFVLGEVAWALYLNSPLGWMYQAGFGLFLVFGFFGLLILLLTAATLLAPTVIAINSALLPILSNFLQI